MRVNRNEIVTALSFALDFLEKGIRENVTNHNRRVSLIAVRLGQALGLDDRELFDLSAYAMLHDSGLTHESYNVMSKNGVDRLERAASHCIKGEENVVSFPFLESREGIILYHHELYDGSGYFEKQGNEIPLFAHIISMADKVEVMYQTGAEPSEITDYVAKAKGTIFSPELCQAFDAVQRNKSFWLSLDNMFIERELNRLVPMFYVELDYPELLRISGIMSEIIDAKSPFTGCHSKGLSQKIGIMADYYDFDYEKKTRLMIAADLHDVGKLVIPNSIIDKPGKLTPGEFNIIKSHTYYTRKVIEAISGFDDICEWASNHHETLDGTGYPYGLDAQDISFESCLMACMDIYQALTETRPYREGLLHERASKILVSLAEKGHVSREITADIIEHFKSLEIIKTPQIST